jgi:hypothetical protein
MGLDIRINVDGFKKLENCTVIEGSLHIQLIDANEKEYEHLHYPHLVEITDHLLLYRVYGLRTLRHIFPNLAVIRGQRLFHNYALVVFEMPDLEELGLVGLTSIMRGAVRLEKNPNLCYIGTIDRPRITNSSHKTMPSDSLMREHFIKNKKTKECVNTCLHGCPRTNVDGIENHRCWSSQDCQKMLGRLRRISRLSLYGTFSSHISRDDNFRFHRYLCPQSEPIWLEKLHIHPPDFGKLKYRCNQHIRLCG